MKKLLFLIILLFMSFTFGQAINKTFTGTPVTMSGADTEDFALPTNYVTTYSGVVGFQFTFTSDTLSAYSLQANISGATNWITLSTVSNAVAGTYFVSDSALEYTTYRLHLATQAGDTLTVTDVKAVYKKE